MCIRDRVESPPADAGDAGSCPGPGRSHMPRSGWAREPWPLSLRIQSLCSATGEATTVRGPRTAKKKNKKKLVSPKYESVSLEVIKISKAEEVINQMLPEMQTWLWLTRQLGMEGGDAGAWQSQSFWNGAPTHPER